MTTRSGLSTGRLRAALPLVLAAALAVSSPAAALETFIRKIPLGGQGFAFDINDSGQVVGFTGSGPTGKAFLFANGTTTFIGPAGWDASIAVRISSNGTIAGFGFDSGVTRGFVRSGGVTTPLMPPGWTEARAMGVNDGAVVVGLGTVGGTEQAFHYSSGLYTPLVPPGFTSSRAHDINGSGHVVGSASNASGRVAFLFDGAYSPAAPAGWTDTEAVRINRRGDILGYGHDGSLIKCFLLKDGVHTIISTPGSPFNLCFDLNDRGDVSGISLDLASGASAFIWRDGKHHFLDRTLATMLGSAPINNSRQLAGGISVNGASRAVTAWILPEASLEVQGSDGPVSAPRSAPPPVRFSLTGWTLAGWPCDWWFFAQTPSGLYSFDLASLSWVPGLSPTVQMPLLDIGPRKLPPAGSAAGPYTYYFGVDFIQNGVMDTRFFFFDSINVFLQ